MSTYQFTKKKVNNKIRKIFLTSLAGSQSDPGSIESAR